MSAYRFLLDTNAASALIRGKEAAAHTLLIEAPVCISVITEAELRFGAARKPGATRLAQAVAENCPLVSANRAFAQVPGLRVMDCAPSPGN